MFPSLANQFCPKTFHDLPWFPEEKESFREFMVECVHNLQQPIFLIVGSKGSGKSLLLHQVVCTLFVETMQSPLSSFESFKRNNVFTISPFRHDQSTLGHSLLNFVHLQSTFHSKRLILVDDFDLCTNTEKAAVHELLTNVHLHPRFCIIATCRSIDHLGERVLRFSRLYFLPVPRLHAQNVPFFLKALKTIFSKNEDESIIEIIKDCWNEGNHHFEGFFQQLDFKLLSASFTNSTTFQESQQIENVISSWRKGDFKNALQILELFSQRGYSLNDFLSLIWQHLQKSYNDDFLILQLLEFSTSSNFRSSSCLQEYKQLNDFLYRHLHYRCQPIVASTGEVYMGGADIPDNEKVFAAAGVAVTSIGIGRVGRGGGGDVI